MATATAHKDERLQLVQEIPIKSIRPSKTNPRKTFAKEYLAELAASIKAQGIVQPLLCRPYAEGGFELVFGECRFRAAKQAGLDTVPSIVRELADKEAAEIQMVENLQRQDLHPLEEAEGYEQLQKAHGYSVDDLAAKVGKSRGYIYGRLKLTALSPKAREAFYAGRILPSTALYVARIPAALQEKAIKAIGGDGKDREPLSAREAFREIQQDFMLRLSEAPFRKDDAELVPAAGPCTTCPKRTGNQKELFSDVQSADVCTDPTCYRNKVSEHTAQRIATHKAAGGEVLQGKEVERVFPYDSPTVAYGSGFVTLDQPCYQDPKGRTYRQLLGKAADEAMVLAKTPAGGVAELVPEKAAKAALRDKGFAFAKAPASTGGARGVMSKADREKEQRKVAILERGDLLAWIAVANAIEKAGPTADVLRLLARLAHKLGGLPEPLLLARYGLKLFGSHDKVEALLARLKPAQLVAFVAENLMASEFGDAEPDASALVKACAALRIDRKKINAEAEAFVDAEAAKATAAKQKEAAPAKAEKKTTKKTAAPAKAKAKTGKGPLARATRRKK